jgi:hypothetical protein
MPAFSKLLLAASLVASAAAGPIVFHHDVPAAPVAAAGAAAGAGSESEMAKLAEQVKALTQTVSAQQAQLKDAQAKPPAAPMSDLESRQRAAIIAEADKIFFKNDDNHDGKLTVNEMTSIQQAVAPDEPDAKQDVADTVKALDTDKDGFVSCSQ